MLHLASTSPSTTRCENCVMLTCFSLEFQFLAALLRYGGVRLHNASSLDQADFLLTVTGASVLLCDTLFLDGGWDDCLRMVSHLHPSVSVVVVAEEADAPFLASARSQGASAILWKPIRISQLQKVIQESHLLAASRA